MNLHLKTFLITLGAVVITSSYVAAISIDGMPGWYYGTLLSMLIIVPSYVIIYISLLSQNKTKKEN